MRVRSPSDLFENDRSERGFDNTRNASIKISERTPEIIGTERGTLGAGARMRALSSNTDEIATAKTSAKTSSRDAFLYFPAYSEKDAQTKNETIAARMPNLKTCISISGGSWPSNLSKAASQEAANQEALSRSARTNLFLVNIVCFGTKEKAVLLSATENILR
jgi:hypothetical protein